MFEILRALRRQPRGRVLKRTFQFLVKPIRPLLRNRVYTMRSGPARGLKRRGGFMFIRTRRTEEDHFLEALPLEGRIVYDLGANIGVMALFFARAVGPTGRVIAFEPNPETIPVVEDHLRLNQIDNVQIICAAVGERAGRGRLVMHRDQRGSASMAASLVKHYERLGDTREFEVDVVVLDDMVSQGRCPAPDLVKMDVEGFEVACLRGMRRILEAHHPDLLVEIHGVTQEERRANAEQVMGLVSAKGYRIYNVQAQTMVDGPDSEAALRGHLFCTTGDVPGVQAPAPQPGREAGA